MEIVVRAAIIFAFLWLVTRAVGRSTLGELSTFELLLYVVMGDLVQQGVTQSDNSVTGAIIVICTITLLTVFLSFVNFRARFLRNVLEGQPVVLVENGQLIERNMRRERITTEDIESEARQQQVTSIDDIRWAVLETSGRISIIPASK